MFMTGRPFDGFASHEEMVTQLLDRCAQGQPQPYSGQHFEHDGHLYWAPASHAEWRLMYVESQDSCGHDRGDEDIER